MTEDRKTWMIEVGDILEITPPEKEQPSTAQAKMPRSEPPRPAPKPRVVKQSKCRIKPDATAKPRMHFAQLVALTYLTGPLAILLTHRGRREKFMIALAGVSVAATAALVYVRFGGLVDVARPGSVWLWVALLTLAVSAGFTVWARSVILASREGIPNLNLLPLRLRRGWVLSIMGLMAPGSGLLISGRPKLAAFTLWMFGLTVWSVVVMLNIMGIWQHHLQSGWLAGSGPLLETAMIIIAGLVTLGILGYVSQTLEGVRRVSLQPGLKSYFKGDYYALALVASVVALVFMANPVKMAHELDLGGDILLQEGFKTIPLQLTLAASHLDPAKPEYSMQAIELYAALGQTEKAEAKRSNLDRNLDSYLAMVQEETDLDASLMVATVARQQQEPVVETKVENEITLASIDSEFVQTMWVPFGMVLPMEGVEVVGNDE